jgi:segregation and condensation protein B
MDEPKKMLEGLIFAAGEEGITAKELANIMQLELPQLEMLLHELRVDYQQQRGLQIVKEAQAYLMTTRPEHTRYLQQMAAAPRRTQLSRAALETLAIIAYRQPITRLDIEEIRGVKSDRLIQQLQRKELIREVGRAEGVGRPKLYGTSKAFLRYFGLDSIEQLPDPHTIFNWQEWEQEKQELFQRLGVEQPTEG